MRGPQLSPRSGSSLLPRTFLCRFDELLSGVRVAGAGSGGHVRWGAVLPRVGCRCARATGGWWTFSLRPWPQELIWLTPIPCKAIAPQPGYQCPFLTGQGSPPPPSPTLLSPRPLLPWALHLAVRGSPAATASKWLTQPAAPVPACLLTLSHTEPDLLSELPRAINRLAEHYWLPPSSIQLNRKSRRSKFKLQFF